jgi:uncharacterized protein (DUF1800 family)
VSATAYTGPFGPQQAERLLWRAGFGPKKGDVAKYTALGLDGAVNALLATKKDKLVGSSPKTEHGRLAPYDAWGHDHLWWLDRMVRTSRPLYERMTLIWHDWFATSNEGVSSQRLMIGQNETFRKYALGSFRDLLLAVTADPAMLLWLSGAENTKDEPNENYGRELMELFTLGADRAGGYTETDVREQARSLTGFRYDWRSSGPTNFRFDPTLHDPGTKTVFGRSGAWSWQDSCRLCLEHPNHPSFFVRKLWSYFIPTAPDPSTQSQLESLYTGGNYLVAPLVGAILRHPDLYDGPSMTKPPVVYTVGILRALGRYIDTSDWVWLDYLCGQQLFYPPNVAGWDDNRWLDTSTYRGRWYVAAYALAKSAIDENKPGTNGQFPADAAKLLDQAVKSLGSPTLEDGARAVLLDFGQRALADAGADWQLRTYPILIYNAMRQLILTAPEAQTC